MLIFLFKLETPVYLGENASPKPINYLTTVYGELRELLGADKAYTGLMSKNPLHESWRTQELHVEPYSLTELSQHLELDSKVVKQSKLVQMKPITRGAITESLQSLKGGVMLL